MAEYPWKLPWRTMRTGKKPHLEQRKGIATKPHTEAVEYLCYQEGTGCIYAGKVMEHCAGSGWPEEERISTEVAWIPMPRLAGPTGILNYIQDPGQAKQVRPIRLLLFDYDGNGLTQRSKMILDQQITGMQCKELGLFSQL